MSFKDFKDYIFNKYPTLESFGWTQYTPYFNDGNETYFRANIDYLFINDEWVEDSEWDSILSEAYSEILEFLKQFDNDFYLEKFGNDAKVKITKDCIEISDHEHE